MAWACNVYGKEFGAIRVELWKGLSEDGNQHWEKILVVQSRQWNQRHQLDGFCAGVEDT